MKRRFGWVLGLALALVPFVGVAGQGHHRQMFVSDDAERFDLSDLADGETRTFGSGDHAMTATREGDQIRIRVGDEEAARTLVCSVGSDTCTVITTADDGRVLLLKTGGDGEGAHESIVLRSGQGENEFFFVPDDEAHAMVFVADGGGDPGAHWIDADGAHTVVEIQQAHGSILRCPEGDTTMRLDRGEEDTGSYLCPRHNLRMEKAKPHGAHAVHEIQVIRSDDE